MIEDGIDIVHVSLASMTTSSRTPDPVISFTEPGCNVYLAEAIKRTGVKIPVMTVGGINTSDARPAILAEGKADIIGMGKYADLYLDFPNKARLSETQTWHAVIRIPPLPRAVIFPSDVLLIQNSPTECFNGAPSGRRLLLVEARVQWRKTSSNLFERAAL